MKLHKESADLFFSGSFGNVFSREFVSVLLSKMENMKQERLDMTTGFFNTDTMICGKGDVGISVTLTLEKLK